VAQPEAVQVENPLASYPDRSWEETYRDLFRYDGEFVFLCAPNDTHNCYLKAYLKEGVIVRLAPTYGYGEARDLYGNGASHRWDPRCCQKGLALTRRIYGQRRVKHPMVRKGFKEWADRGFPRDPRTGRPVMDTSRRGEDEWLQIGWDEALELAARVYLDIARTYSGERGKEYLRRQGYHPAMVERTEGAGTRVMKFRGGMPLLGVSRLFGLYRMANCLALLDAHVRKVGPEEARGGIGWDNYTWHTDLPPGHPMVTGQQTVDFDLHDAENASLIVLFGMNWISTKMPDSHWLTEARLKGTRVIAISVDYQSTATKADRVILIRPGTDAALALGCASYLMEQGLYDEDYVRSWTDLPLLVRLDNLALLRAREVIPGYQPRPLRETRLLREGESPPPPARQETQYIEESLRREWDDFLVWDRRTGSPQPLSREEVGERFRERRLDPALEGTFEVQTVEGKKVQVRPVFSLIREYLRKNLDLTTASEITWAPREAIEDLAREIARNRGKTLLVTGMGPNHFFNADLKDRAIFLLAALTGNVGRLGGNVGSYAGNYRGALFHGVLQWTAEDPFHPELDPQKPARVKLPSYYRMESAHYLNYGDRPLVVGKKLLTGKSHMPTPTKLVHFANSNSLLGNAKWHYDLIKNTLPRVEVVIVQDWWWTMSCEHADLVFPVDSWAEFKQPDLAASATNPFLYVYPVTPLERLHDTRSDLQVLAGIAEKLSRLTGENRFRDYFRFVLEDRVEVYLQRILNASSATSGYRFEELHEKARRGIPFLMNTRTYPRSVGWEQVSENRPWYTKTGRLEFYREEPEFLEYGENLPVWREPVDATFYEPNVILGKNHVALRPRGPREYGLDPQDLSPEARQGRNVVRSWSELRGTVHPLKVRDDRYRFIFLTPKYRHGAHTFQADADWVAVWFGPFGDYYRLDRRQPWVNEAYLELNPEEARSLGIEDGDYVWFDADPSDRPYRGWKPGDPFYRVARGMARARYQPALPPGVARMWFNMYAASWGSVAGHSQRPDGLARSPRTGYQAQFRFGSHQSGTRAWLRPTLMTDSLVRKNYFGQVIKKGFEADVHAANGAPKESIIRVEKAEDGGRAPHRLWLPAREGYRVGYESEGMKRYLAGEFLAL